MGLPAFRAKVEEYLGNPLADPKPQTVREVDDHLGWHPQGDGKLWLGLPVENGRIKDEGKLRLATALRSFFDKHRTPARLTCQQSILLCDIEPALKTEIDDHFRGHGVALAEEVSQSRRWSMACPAFPTCGLAVTEAERAFPGVIDQLEIELDRLGLAKERFTTRMTGCPNGCTRPYNAEIGLVGRSTSRNEDGTPGPGSYTIFLGGSTVGDRLNTIFKDYVPIDRVVAELVPVFQRFKEEKQPDESLGDFCRRVGVEASAVKDAPRRRTIAREDFATDLTRPMLAGENLKAGLKVGPVFANDAIGKLDGKPPYLHTHHCICRLTVRGERVRVSL